MRSWLFLPPSAAWEEVVEAAAERHAGLHSSALQRALKTYLSEEQPGGWAPLKAEAAAATPYLQLPARLQMLLLLELHAALHRRFGAGSSASGGGDEQELLTPAEAHMQAPSFLRCVGWHDL